MRKNFLYLLLFLVFPFLTRAQQTIPTPDRVYGPLFTAVQMQRIFPDNKTFADVVPQFSPSVIVQRYKTENTDAAFSLKEFVERNFSFPAIAAGNYHSDTGMAVEKHIEQLWTVLRRQPDKPIEGSSLIPLPNPYIVPGGRFQEIYYWDSYFTMLGLAESGQYGLMESMINNFAFLINRYGHIPNGNRTYFLSRSQPPYFSLMVDLLAQKKGNAVYRKYAKALGKEYDYWMDKSAPTSHVVQLRDGAVLNRYWDQLAIPRQESFFEDSSLAVGQKDIPLLYRNLRSGAESGWDFSSRWFRDGKTLATIHTTDILPVDLNCLLYHLELTLAKSYSLMHQPIRSATYTRLAAQRKKAIEAYFYNAADGWYYDYDLSRQTLASAKTIAGITPFFFAIAPEKAMDKAAQIVRDDFLQPGGVQTTLVRSGQQWDAPNGWAPLQWITISGLENYGQHGLADTIARRWIGLNIRVYKQTGKLMEKYNVVDTAVPAGGGEYASQDGFGWTNGVLLKLLHNYDASSKYLDMVKEKKALQAKTFVH